MRGAALAVGAKLVTLSNTAPDSPLRDAGEADVELYDGRLRLKKEPTRGVRVAGVMRKNGVTEITETFMARPSPERDQYTSLAHGALTSLRGQNFEFSSHETSCVHDAFLCWHGKRRCRTEQ